MRSRSSTAMTLGVLAIAAGLALIIAPADLEERVGLPLLFWIRGRREPPADVVVVGIDEAASSRLRVSRDPARWPRTLHARLTTSLANAGARAIAFDVVFRRQRTAEEDTAFAAAMRAAGNVVLAQYCTRRSATGSDEATWRPAPDAVLETLVSPAAPLADAAAALAPDPLPKTPPGLRRFWTFKPAAGDVPTLPAAALQIFALSASPAVAAATAATAALVRERPSPADGPPRDPGRPDPAALDVVMRRVRDGLTENAALTAAVRARLRAAARGGDDHTARLTRALLDLYGGDDSRYLNPYAPPGTIPTIAYDRVLAADGDAPDVNGKAVFVGLSHRSPTEQKDGFVTPFSRADRLDMSGVEIAATAFANLLDGSTIERLSGWRRAAAMAVPPLALAAAAVYLPATLAVVATLAIVALYLGLASYVFATHACWLPVTPVLLQAPLVFLGGMLHQRWRMERERRNVRRAFAHYVPAPLVDRLLDEPPSGETREILQGTCLFTDAEHYTTLAESLDPHDLATFMNEYLGTMFDPVQRYGGLVSTVAGDSVLAVWPSGDDDPSARARACLAGLDIVTALDRFNAGQTQRALPTRIGLHSGRLVLGNLGAGGRYEYRAIGDIVNVASRLEGLNKYLGTRILASADAVHGLEAELLIRDLGRFLLMGKSRAVAVRELVCRRATATPAQLELQAVFGEALGAYRERRWEAALDLFQQCAMRAPGDGPSRFYIRLCTRARLEATAAAWDGVVRLAAK